MCNSKIIQAANAVLKGNKFGIGFEYRDGLWRIDSDVIGIDTIWDSLQTQVIESEFYFNTDIARYYAFRFLKDYLKGGNEMKKDVINAIKALEA